MQITSFNIGGINTYSNPLNPSSANSALGFNQINQGVQQDGILIRSVNTDSYPLGGKQKRPGYTTYLGTADNNPIIKLFSFTKDDGTTLFTYRQSGTLLYYSTQGTGDWTIAGNGTLTAGSALGYNNFKNTLLISQGGGTTRHSTDGINFTDTSLAPAGPFVADYQNRSYITGTSSVLFYSSANDPTNWNISGTSDSSSVNIAGAGIPNQLFKLSDRLIIPKSSNLMYRWDGDSLVDMATDLGPSSPQSFARVEDYGFWLNRLGFFISNGGVPELISNAIQRQIYNDQQSGIAGTSFDNAPGEVFKYDYFTSVGSVRDDLTNEPLDKAVIKYNYQKNEWLNYSFYDQPTAFHSFIDTTRNKQLIFGNSTGQAFKYGGTATSDNGQPIATVMDLLYHLNYPHVDKEFRWIWLFFNPGCQAKVQIAVADTFTKGSKKWLDVGDVSSGIVQFRFPAGSKGKLLFLRIYEASRDSRYDYYGCAIDANLNPQA